MKILKNHLFPAAFLAGLLLFSTSCEDEKLCPGSVTETYSVSNFDRLVIADAFHLQVQKGSSFSVSAEGCADDLADLDVHVSNGTLEVDFENWIGSRDRVDLTITMPELEAFDFAGAIDGRISGFEQNADLQGRVAGACEITFSGKARKFDLILSGASQLSLLGTVDQLDADISGTSNLKAYSAQAATARVTAIGSSRAWIQAQESLTAKATGTSKIYYKGNPANTEITTEGLGKVVKE